MHAFFRRGSRGLLVTSVACFTLSIARVRAVTISGIPTLGGPISHAWALNDNGMVVGEANFSQATSRKPYSRTASDGITGLAPLDDHGGYAYGINASGVMVGDSPNGGSFDRPVKWTGNQTSAADLSDPVHRSGFASAINDLGVIVGGYSVGAPSYDIHASRWDSAGGFLDLGVLPGDETSRARAINAAGTIVGESQDVFANAHAFIYTPADGIQKITVPGVIVSFAWAINSSGIVAGSSSAGPYKWSAASGFQALGTNPGGEANGINDAGSVVGDGAGRAWIWTDGALASDGVPGGMVDLNTLLSPTDAARWTLEYASDINNANQICGYGLFDDDNNPSTQRVMRGFLLSIPEPSTFMASVYLCLAARRRSPRADATSQATS